MTLRCHDIAPLSLPMLFADVDDISPLRRHTTRLRFTMLIADFTPLRRLIAAIDIIYQR